jgi:hypothetical protein
MAKLTGLRDYGGLQGCGLRGHDTNCVISLVSQIFCQWRGHEFLRRVGVGTIAIPPTRRAVDFMEASFSGAFDLSRARLSARRRQAGFAP